MVKLKKIGLSALILAISFCLNVSATSAITYHEGDNKTFEEKPCFTIVAKTKESQIGHIDYIFKDSNSIYITYIYVSYRYRSRKIFETLKEDTRVSEELIKMVINKARSSKIHKITLKVAYHFEKVKKFYETLGFKDSEKQPEENFYYMEMEL